MRKSLMVVLITLLPITGTVAQDSANTESHGSYGIQDALLISVGIVAGVIIVDYLVSGALTVPKVTAVALEPVVQEASAAGAVFGDQVAAGTASMDAKARIDVMYALLVGSGAVLGGLIFNQISSFMSSPR